MGKGEEGLVRALTFGKQTLTGYFCDNDLIKKQKIKIGFDMDKIAIYKNFFDIALWVVNLQEGRSDIWVSTLQKYLIKLGFLKDGRQTGYFGKETKSALCSYQVARGLSYKSSKYCGYFSTSTSFRMKEEIKQKGLFPDDLREVGNISNLKKIAKNYSSNIVVDVSNQYFNYPFKRGNKSDLIKTLQTVLINLGIHKGEINGIYDNNTISAVYDFQLKMGILKSDDKNVSARGWLGPSTRNKLNMLVSDNEGLLILKEKKVDSGSSSTITLRLREVQAPEGQSSEQKKEQKGNVFQFYRPYKKGDQNGEIRILQKFLSGENLYKGKIDGVYSVSVINSLCQFQKNNELWVSGNSIALCGYLGPKTREIINGKL
ncbi:peptidoglycan-binding protein [Candidatus Gracilibacteria bacterium]|nr:peptidoglycan-binding protein [Candidatus Gracilibacteria bacterium]